MFPTRAIYNLAILCLLIFYQYLTQRIHSAYITIDPHPLPLQVSVLTIAAGAVLAGWDSLRADLLGYGLTMLNNVITAAMFVMQKQFSKATGLSTFSVVLSNSVVRQQYMPVISAFEGNVQKDCSRSRTRFHRRNIVTYHLSPAPVPFFMLLPADRAAHHLRHRPCQRGGAQAAGFPQPA